MKKLYLVRHGETLFNKKKIIQGACDSPLTERGIQQALKVKKVLENVEIEGFYCSTQERAVDTLELILGQDKSYTRLKGLKERNFGLFEGEREVLNPTWENGYDEIFPLYGGETSDEVKIRVAQSIYQIINKHNSALVVAHAGSIYHFLRYALEKETLNEIMSTTKIPNCSIIELEYTDAGFEYKGITITDSH